MKQNKIAAIISWCFVAACMAVIFCLSAQEGGESQTLSDNVVKLLGFEISVDFVRSCAHCIEFAGLAALIFNALFWSFGNSRPLTAFLITAAYAASDEIHQLFVEGRACQLSDFFVDCLGAIAGTAAVWILITLIRRRFS